MGEFAGHQIGLIALRYRDHHVGILGTRLTEHRWRSRIAHHRTQVEPVLQVGQALTVMVNDGDVVFFGDQAFRHTGANLSGAQNDHFHILSSSLPSA